MEEQKLIQISVQLPASELGRLSALLEQFQRVLDSGQAEGFSSPGNADAAERGENTAFDQMRFSALNEGTEARSSAPAQAASVQATAEADTAAPVSAVYEPERRLPQAAASAAPELSAEAEQDVLPPFRQASDEPAIQAAAEGGGDTPPSAGFAVEDSAGGTSSGVKNGLEERLMAAGPAPLTAEAVALAFRRDDRRYDNGFPLY